MNINGTRNYRERFDPGTEGLVGLLLQEDHFPVIVAKRRQVAVIREIEDFPARALFFFTKQERQEVVAVKMDLVLAADRLDAAFL